MEAHILIMFICFCIGMIIAYFKAVGDQYLHWTLRHELLHFSKYVIISLIIGYIIAEVFNQQLKLILFL